ncbi:MAG TPA: adenosine deaminase [Roseiflexaceae bacterium]|nr:adenosine deaminase [Roseiflexaceae bacterium]
MDPAALPKVELHLHLDCSLSYAAVAQLDPAVGPAEYQARFVAPAKCASLADFLTRPPQMVALLQTQAALRLAVRDLFDQLARDRVIYAEVRFAPLLHTAGGLLPAAVVAAVERETAACTAETGIAVRLLLCTLRHFTAAQSLETAALAVQFQRTLVAGLDIAGDETLPLAPHAAAFVHAHAHGIPCTAHAGEAREAGGPASVRETLALLGPRRIGHGVRSAEDPALVQALARDGIHLEVCPTCNVQIDLFPTYADHPLDRLYRAGVALNLNTDTRAVTAVTLTEEYARTRWAFGWSATELLATNRMALRAAFAPADLRATLEARLEQAYTAADTTFG